MTFCGVFLRSRLSQLLRPSRRLLETPQATIDDTWAIKTCRTSEKRCFFHPVLTAPRHNVRHPPPLTFLLVQKDVCVRASLRPARYLAEAINPSPRISVLASPLPRFLLPCGRLRCPAALLRAPAFLDRRCLTAPQASHGSSGRFVPLSSSPRRPCPAIEAGLGRTDQDEGQLSPYEG